MRGDYRRIAVVGSGGSGKSTLARQIAAITGLPIIHLDMEFWRPGWKQMPKDEWIVKMDAMTRGESWIMDGNYGGTLEARFAAADLIIFLDISRFICLFRVLRRRNKNRPDFPDYLQEKFDWTFLKWIWDFPKNSRKHILKLHEKHPDTPFVAIRNKRELRRILEDFNEHRT
jgi:adenylate kinase family enzyme